MFWLSFKFYGNSQWISTLQSKQSQRYPVLIFFNPSKLPSTFSFTYSFIHLFIHSSMYSSIHPSMHQSITHPCIHSSIHSFIYLLTHLVFIFFNLLSRIKSTNRRYTNFITNSRWWTRTGEWGRHRGNQTTVSCVIQ